MTRQGLTLPIESPVDTETGEVLVTEEDMRSLLIANDLDINNKDNLHKYVDEIGDRISSKLERARRIREQADRRAAPLEKSAHFLLDAIRPLIIELAEYSLPKDKYGKYRTKTLDLPSSRFSFRKAGGSQIVDKLLAINYALDNPETKHFVDYIPKLDDKGLIAFIHEAKIPNSCTGDFLLEESVNEFAKVTCVLPKESKNVSKSNQDEE